MDHAAFARVDQALEEMLLQQDPVLGATLAASHAAGLRAIQVSALQGRLLTLFAEMIGAKRILEIGTLGGYSALCLARGMSPLGRLISMEVDAHHVKVARENIARAGFSDRIEVRHGAAKALLDTMLKDEEGPFDLCFIDANKEATPSYLEACLRLCRAGSVIVIDNVVRDGEVADPTSHDPDVRGVREALSQVGRHPGLRATALQTVGTKGYDGFALIRVEAVAGS